MYEPTDGQIEALAMWMVGEPSVHPGEIMRARSLTRTPAFQAIIRAAQAEAWDSGYGDCWNYHQSCGLAGRESNRYREDRIEAADV